MIRLVWIDKETKAWGSDPWLEYTAANMIKMTYNKIFNERENPQYEYHIEER